MKFTRTFDASHQATSKLEQAEIDILNTLERDWRNLTATGDISGRFDPTQLDAALPHAFMLERTAPGSVRTRVAGQRLHQILQMDPRGMLFTAFFTPAARDTVTRLAETAFDEPAIVGIPLTAARGLGRKPFRAEVLFLPMPDAYGQLTKVMGALVVSGDTGGRRLRFDIAKDQPVRCDAIRRPMIERRKTRAAPPADAPTSAPQPMAETLPRVTRTHVPTGFRESPAPDPRPRTRPHLRLVVDNT